MTLKSPDLYLVEIDAYDPVGEAIETLRYSNLGYTTGPDRTNLSPRASELDHADWTKSRTSVSANADTAPDGTTTADRLIEDATAANSHRAYSANLVTIGDGATVTVSRFLKAATRTWAFFGVIDNTEVRAARTYFNLATGELGNSPVDPDGGIVLASGIERNDAAWGAGWLRCWVTVNMGAGVTGIRHYLGLATGNNGATYSGDGASYIRAWGAQTEEASGMSDYIETTTAAVQRVVIDTPYTARVETAVDIRRDLFNVGTTSGRSRTAVGDVKLINLDGGLDQYIDYGFDGREIRILRAGSNPRPEYPLGFTTVFVGTIEAAEFSREFLTLKVRDEQLALSLPIQATKYDGDNVPPDGLEGTEDLLGKPKPLNLGTTKNVTPVCVNPAKLIYQLHDGALGSVDDVYDKGMSLKASPADWSDTSTFAGITDARALCFGDGLWVAGGTGGTETSPDGETWTARTTGIQAQGIAYSPELDLFVAVQGSTGTNDIETSPDGITWTARNSGVAQILNAVAWCPNAGLFVAVGNAGTCLTSPTGTTWTSRTSQFGGTHIWGVVEGADIIVIVGEDGKVSSSPDGITWTTRTSLFAAGEHLYAAVYGVGRFVIGGHGGNIATSVDGQNWTLGVSGLSGDNGVHRLLYGTYGGGWFVMSEFATGSILASRDGLNWTMFPNAAVGFYEVAYAATLGVFGGCRSTGFRNTPEISDYGSLADLEDDSLAPKLGTYKTYLAGGYIRLGSSPFGQVTADASEGANDAARTAGQLFVRVLQKMGYTTGDWSASDVTALDSAAAYVLGIYINEERDAAGVLDEIANSVGAAWFVDASGVFRIVQLTLPSGSAVQTFTANDFLSPLERVRVNDAGRGVPPYRFILRYAKNYTPQTTDLAAGVSDERRALVGKQWLEVSAEDTDIQTVHPLASERIIETLIAEEADATTEVARLLTLHGTRRDYFEGEVAYTDEEMTRELNHIVQVTQDRFGLDAGKKFRVLSLGPKNKGRRMFIALWGGVAA